MLILNVPFPCSCVRSKLDWWARCRGCLHFQRVWWSCLVDQFWALAWTWVGQPVKFCTSSYVYVLLEQPNLAAPSRRNCWRGTVGWSSASNGQGAIPSKGRSRLFGNVGEGGRRSRRMMGAPVHDVLPQRRSNGAVSALCNVPVAGDMLERSPAGDGRRGTAVGGSWRSVPRRDEGP